MWCLASWRISSTDLNEICAVAATVAEGRAAPERALARHRSGVALDDVHHRLAIHSAFDPPPLPLHEPQVVRLRLLADVVFADPYHSTDWMVRWAFFNPRRRHRHPRFTATITWFRQALDILAARAGERVREASRTYRNDFFQAVEPRTWPLRGSEFDFWAYGYGDVPDVVMEASVAEQARAFDWQTLSHVEVALAGDAKALYKALREAGTAALRWPWLLRVLDGWRAALEHHAEHLGSKESQRRSDMARDRLDRISAQLVVMDGRGRRARPDRKSNIREAAELLRSYLVASVRDKTAPTPSRLLEIGEAAHVDWTDRIVHLKRRHTYTRLDADALAKARRRLKDPEQAARVSREVVAAAFAMSVATVDRLMVGHGEKRSRRGIRNRR